MGNSLEISYPELDVHDTDGKGKFSNNLGTKKYRKYLK